MDYITTEQIDGISSATGARLKKEKKVVLTVLAEHGETYWEGGINGHFFRIKTGVPVLVPESLAALIQAGARTRAESKSALARFEQGSGLNITA